MQQNPCGIEDEYMKEGHRIQMNQEKMERKRRAQIKFDYLKEKW
jgi:hypothetical protein